jgi:hypothetical protein
MFLDSNPGTRCYKNNGTGINWNIGQFGENIVVCYMNIVLGSIPGLGKMAINKLYRNSNDRTVE